MAKIYRLAVCEGPNCTFNGGKELLRAVREAVTSQGLQPRCQVTHGGCYGMCAFGPNLLIRAQDASASPAATADFLLQGTPDELFYSDMTADRADRLVAEHVGQDRPVAEWLHANRHKGEE